MGNSVDQTDSAVKSLLLLLLLVKFHSETVLGKEWKSSIKGLYGGRSGRGSIRRLQEWKRFHSETVRGKEWKRFHSETVRRKEWKRFHSESRISVGPASTTPEIIQQYKQVSKSQYMRRFLMHISTDLQSHCVHGFACSADREWQSLGPWRSSCLPPRW